MTHKKSNKKQPEPATRAGKGANGPQTRRERVASKEDAIVSAATEMFMARGFAKTTISDIAGKASVAEGTVYLYFANKDALAHAVLAAFYRGLTQKAQAGVVKFETTSDRLAFLARHHLDSIIKNRTILELITITDRDAQSYKGSDLYKMNREYVAVFDGVVREGVWRGEIDDKISLWIFRDIFFGGLEYAMRTILINNRRKDIDQVVSELVQMVTLPTAEQGKAAASISASSSDISKIAARMEKAATRLEEIVADRSANKK